MLVIRIFFELDVEVFAEVDLVARTSRAGELNEVLLGVVSMRRRAVPVACLVATTDRDAPNGLGIK